MKVFTSSSHEWWIRFCKCVYLCYSKNVGPILLYIQFHFWGFVGVFFLFAKSMFKPKSADCNIVTYDQVLFIDSAGVLYCRQIVAHPPIFTTVVLSVVGNMAVWQVCNNWMINVVISLLWSYLTISCQLCGDSSQRQIIIAKHYLLFLTADASMPIGQIFKTPTTTTTNDCSKFFWFLVKFAALLKFMILL